MAIKQRFRVPVLALAIAGALGLTGYTYNTSTGLFTWSYFTTSANAPSSGSTTAVSYDTTTGLPINVNDFLATDSTGSTGYNVKTKPLPLVSLLDMVPRIGTTLPEGVNVAKNKICVNPAGCTGSGNQYVIDYMNLYGDETTNIELIKDADIWVTFLNETAGYLNSLGFFVYDPKNPPKSRSDITTDQILFPNASTPTPGVTSASPLVKAGVQGSTFYLGKIPAGKAVGFFIVSNGWANNGRATPSGYATSPAGLKKINGVLEGKDPNWIFYSIKGFNVENSTNPSLAQHTLVLDDQTLVGSDNNNYERLVLGFEDYQRTSVYGDSDFNDVVLAVHVSLGQNKPGDVIGNFNKLPKNKPSVTNPDSDGDGVPDSIDEFPHDGSASSSRWPLGNSSTWGTLAYEDRWPAKGDYDMNDMVVRYRTKEILNSAGKVSRVEVEYSLDARGGVYNSGFGVALPNISVSNIDTTTVNTVDIPGTTLTDSYKGTTTAVAPLSAPPFSSSDSTAVFQLFKDAYTYTASANGCGNYYNTPTGCTQQASSTFKLVVKFKVPVDSSSFPASPYDPFIFRTATKINDGFDSLADSDVEIHLPGQQPTKRAGNYFMRTGSDDATSCTNPGNPSTRVCTHSYMTANNLPWALNIPNKWAYPLEGINVVKAYSTIVNWAQSGGTQNATWYQTPTDPSSTYTGK